MHPEEREKKISEMKDFVISVIDGAVQKKGSKSDTKMQSDLSSFSEDVKNIVDSDFEKKSSEVTHLNFFK